MATKEKALEIIDLFKKDYWQKNKNIYNAIGIGVDVFFNEQDMEIEKEEYFIKAFMFNVDDALDLPKNIDGVEIKYFKT